MANPLKAVVLTKESNLKALEDILQGFEPAFSYHKSFEELNPPNIIPMLVILYEAQNLPDFPIELTSLRSSFRGAAYIMIQEAYDEVLADEFIAATSGHYYLRSQLALLPATIRHIIRWQNRSEDRNSMIQHQQAALVSLATNPSLNSGGWEDALRQICSVTSKTLGVSRVSVWLFDSLRSKIVCQMLYKLNEDGFEQGIELHASDYPSYFAALNQNRVLSASLAHQHPDTAEFSSTYLGPLNIESMLDAPIRVAGMVHGALCFEHQHESVQFLKLSLNPNRALSILSRRKVQKSA